MLAALVVASFAVDGCQLGGPAPQPVQPAGGGAPPNVGTPPQPPNETQQTPPKEPELGPREPVGPNPPIKPIPPDNSDPGPPPLTPGVIGGGSSGGSGGSSGLSTPVFIPASLTGKVKAPAALISNNGGSLISNNGAQILANNGAGIVSNNSAGIISDHAAGIISDHAAGVISPNTSRFALLSLPASYHLQDASGADGPLSNAFLYLTTRDQKFYYDDGTRKAFVTTSDTRGEYRFPQSSSFPTGKDVVVNALLPGNLRLVGYIVPGSSGAQLDIDLATTVCTEFLRGAAASAGRELKSYDQTLFDKAVTLTRQAMQSGDIAALRSISDGKGGTVKVGTFDLRVDHVVELRNQYVGAISAVNTDNTLVKQISDVWTQLLGSRPSVITTMLGNGSFPAKVSNGLNSASRTEYGRVTGNHVTGGTNLPGPQLPYGWPNGVAIAQRGDIFTTTYTNGRRSGHIRWIKPDGTITSVWLPNRYLVTPNGITVEREPVDDVFANDPGTLLVTDDFSHRIFRIRIVDAEKVDASYLDPISGRALARFTTEVVAGEATAQTDGGALDPEHPLVVDGDVYDEQDPEVPKASSWRLSDEGQRRYVSDGELVPNPARFAYLARPTDVAVDELGNIYFTDTATHRVRMIPAVTGRYFKYRQPIDGDGDGIIDSFGAEVDMHAGCLYTIAGNPAWDTAQTGDDGFGHWFGEYANSDNMLAQEAHFDQPCSVKFYNGALYVCDYDNQRVRRISRSSGLVDTVAGNPTGGQRDNGGGDHDYQPGNAGEGGPANLAQLAFPNRLSIDGRGRIFISDLASGRIVMVDEAGKLHNVAGRARDPESGDSTDQYYDGDALRWADVYEHYGLAVDADGNVVFVDSRHVRLRKLWRQWD
jgi:hypothetical protein